MRQSLRAGISEKWIGTLSEVQSAVAGDLERIALHIDRLLDSGFRPIDEVFVHLFSKTGKMIRPTLLLLAADRGKADPEGLVSMGAAIELIHTASLVHDDSIDSSNYRRGVETLNSKWNHKTSVIIGDYLLAQAFSEITRLNRIEIFVELTSACRSLAAGEMRQMAMEGDLEATEKDYFAFIREKTASLFAATCSVASILSGDRESEELKEFGLLFGSIFQITDDLLDYIGFSPDTGKPTGLDLLERKMTLPLIYALSRMDEAARDQFRQAFSDKNGISREQAGHLSSLVIEAGGIDYSWFRVTELARQASGVLESLSPDRSEKLKKLVDVIVERDR